MDELTRNGVLASEDGKQQQIRGDDVFINFMTKVINESKSNLEEYLQSFIQDWISSGTMNKASWTGGVSALIQQLEGFAEDLPILPGLFGEKIVVLLLKA